MEVQEKPAFKEVPVSKRYPNSQTIRLNCTASGHPKPKIFWLKNGKRFNTDARLKHSSNGIVFSHSFVSDEGTYEIWKFPTMPAGVEDLIIWLRFKLNNRHLVPLRILSMHRDKLRRYDIRWCVFIVQFDQHPRSAEKRPMSAVWRP